MEWMTTTKPSKKREMVLEHSHSSLREIASELVSAYGTTQQIVIQILRRDKLQLNSPQKKCISCKHNIERRLLKR